MFGDMTRSKNRPETWLPSLTQSAMMTVVAFFTFAAIAVVASVLVVGAEKTELETVALVGGLLGGVLTVFFEIFSPPTSS